MTELQGVNHADFGAYGAQPGDRTATVPRAQARAEIAAAVTRWVDGLRASGLH